MMRLIYSESVWCALIGAEHGSDCDVYSTSKYGCAKASIDPLDRVKPWVAKCCSESLAQQPSCPRIENTEAMGALQLGRNLCFRAHVRKKQTRVAARAGSRMHRDIKHQSAAGLGSTPQLLINTRWEVQPSGFKLLPTLSIAFITP